MEGNVVVITGATSGIGQVAAERLAAMGARIVLVARDRQRGKAALERLRKIAPSPNHTIHYADLLQLGETRGVAAEIAAAEPRIDVLMNNAGAMFSSRQVVEGGLERTFALNHMSYFLMTHGLLHRLLASAPARVVNTSSDAHKVTDLDFGDLQAEHAYSGSWKESLRYGGPGFKVYGRSKLCNILFTRELARRLTGRGVTANCCHPGFVATRFGDQTGGWISLAIRIAKRFATSPEEGAKTLVYLASSPEVANVTGQYFQNCHSVRPAPQAEDDAAAERLWQETAKLAGLPE